MKTSIKSFSPGFFTSMLALVSIVALLAAIPGTARAQILVTDYDNNTITDYTSSGAPVGSGTLINGSGLYYPWDIAVSGSDVFVLNYNTITEYTTSGAPVGSGTLVNGLAANGPQGIAVSGSDIFVVNSNYSPNINTITEYTTSGAPVGSGTLVNGLGLDGPEAIAVSGSDIFVVNQGNFSITEYTTAGVPVGSGTLVSGDGLDDPEGIAVIPEPATWGMVFSGVGMIVCLQKLRRRRLGV